MVEQKLKLPEVTTFCILQSEKMESAMAFHQPQVVQHLAFAPIETQNIAHQLLETISLIEEFKLEQDIIVKDTTGSYNSAIYVNKTPQVVIVPPATHLKGGKQNRGNNQTEVLAGEEEQRFDVNCFEPGRGDGIDRFDEFDDTPADVAQATMVHRGGYEGSWETIRDYTSLVRGLGRDALSQFNEATKDIRAQYALNFETRPQQTGVAIITAGLCMVEIFPTPNTFNIYRHRVIRGKVASLFYKMAEKHQGQVLLPSMVEQKMTEMKAILEKALDQTLTSGIKKHGLIIGRHRYNGKALDIILTDTDPPQLAYLFGAWSS